MRKKRITILIHITCWLFYILLPVAFSPGFGARATGFPHLMGYPLHMLVFSLSLIPFFYFNAYFLVPRFFFTNKHLIYYSCIFFFLLLLFVVPWPERHLMITNARGVSPFPGAANNGFPRPPLIFRHAPRIFSFYWFGY